MTNIGPEALIVKGDLAPTRRHISASATYYKKYRAYGAIMGTRPQTIGYALTDSPVGLAAWIFDYNNGEPERRLNRDDVLDNVTLYWLTNTATSAARLYWETAGQSVVLSAAQKTSEISLPVAISVLPDEVYRAPETWARRAYRNLVYFNEVDKGGHFAAWDNRRSSRPSSASPSARFGRHTDQAQHERTFPRIADDPTSRSGEGKGASTMQAAAASTRARQASAAATVQPRRR